MNVESFKLTLEQQFQMRLIEHETEALSREQMSELLIQTSRLLMVKDNIIRDLIRQPAV
jgi:Phycobilisome degradation protein nblA